MSFINQLQRILGKREDKQLEIVLYSDDELCFYILEERIPISVFPKNNIVYIDCEGTDFHFDIQDIKAIHDVMILLTGAMPEIREWVEGF